MQCPWTMHPSLASAGDVAGAIAIAARGRSMRAGGALHAAAAKLGLSHHNFVLNSLLHMYTRCSTPAAARSVLRFAPHDARDAVSYNTVIAGFVRHAAWGDAMQVFAEMISRGVRMDSVTAVNVLAVCGRIGRTKLGRVVHAATIVNGFEVDSHLGSSLLSMYAKCNSMRQAQKVFDRMPERNVNAVCWTALIVGYTKSGRFKKAISLFWKMQSAGVVAEDATVASVVSACAQMGALEHGKHVHSYCDAHGIGNDIAARNALIDMYSKCGDVESAYNIFTRMSQHDVFSWSTIITGFALNGHSIKAIGLFSQMEETDIVPNDVTLLGVLAACSHAGLLEQGFYYFDRMSTRYNLVPKIEHYGCMVDLFGRAGLLNEAVKFINRMPIKPDAVIWRSVLFSCRAAGDIKLAKYAAKKVMQLEPKKCAAPVLLASTYATTSMWGNVSSVRRRMSRHGIEKNPGCSYIEVDGCIHEFLATDVAHADCPAIYKLLSDLNEHTSAAV